MTKIKEVKFQDRNGPKKRKSTRKKPDKLKIIPLGGQEEVGRNMTVFEYKDDIVILDMGLQFPEEDMPGIDYIIPNISYLNGKEKNIKAVILSHGHLDHIGATPILLERLGYPPIVARPLTVAMVKHRLEDYKKGSLKNLKTILIKDIKNRFKFGNFNISFFQIEHSIMDAVGTILKTPYTTIIHPGDWTLERNSQGKPLLNYSFLSRLSRPIILMLESLGATDIGPGINSEEMKKNITDLIKKAPGRIIIGTFSSQIERINWIFYIAAQLGRRVVLDGYSMRMNVEIARKLGYVKIRKGTLIKINQIKDYPDNKILILCTGSQGEGNAVLSRIVENEHKYIKLKKSDTIVLSSSIIPGNERTIQRLKDNLYRLCDNVIHGNIMDVHVSGHGNQSAIAYMLKTIKPDYFIPVYAHHYMLKEAAKIAKSVGIKNKNIFIADNGQVIEVNKRGVRLTSKKVPTDYVMVDGLGVGDISNIVLRDRRAMAEDGMIVLIATVQKKTGKLIGNPDIISRGFVYMKESKELIEQTRKKVKKILQDKDPKTSADDMYLKNKMRDVIGQFLFSKTRRRPMILPVIISV